MYFAHVYHWQFAPLIKWRCVFREDVKLATILCCVVVICHFYSHIIFTCAYFAASDDTELLDNMYFEEEDWNVRIKKMCIKSLHCKPSLINNLKLLIMSYKCKQHLQLVELIFESKFTPLTKWLLYKDKSAWKKSHVFLVCKQQILRVFSFMNSKILKLIPILFLKCSTFFLRTLNRNGKIQAVG